MTRPSRNGRQDWVCPHCGKLLVFVRGDMTVLRRLTFTEWAKGHDDTDGVVTVRCQCGGMITIRRSVMLR